MKSRLRPGLQRGMSGFVVLTLLVSLWWPWAPLGMQQVAYAAGATYYVDAAAGSDSNDGLSEASAWKTIAKVNATAYAAGDRVLFKRGERWNGAQLSPSSSGAAGNPIVYGAYGPEELPKPVISAATITTGWSGPDEYGEYALGGYPSGNSARILLLEDGVRLNGKHLDTKLPGTVKGSLEPGTWTWDSVTSSVYYKPTSGTPGDHRVEISVFGGPVALNITAKTNIVVQDLALSGGYTYAVLIYNGSAGIVLERNDIFATSGFGVRLFQNADDNRLEANAIRDIGNAGIIVENGSDRTVIKDNRITEVGRLPMDETYLAGIYIGKTSSAQTPSEQTVIEGNEIDWIGRDWYRGKGGSSTQVGLMHSAGVFVESSPGTVIQGNNIHDSWRSGILVWTTYSDSTDTRIVNNLIHRIGKMTELNLIGSGIYLSHAVGKLDGSRVYHNTIADSEFRATTGSANREAGIFLRVQNTATAPGANLALDDVQIRNNLIAGNGGNYTLTIEQEPGTTATQLSSDYNLLRPGSGSSGVYYRDSGGVRAYAADKIVGTAAGYYSYEKNQDAHSTTGDPLFADAASADYSLLPGSAAIDAGTATDVSVDYAGAARPYRLQPDIGAYEDETLLDTTPPVVTGVSEGGTYTGGVTITFNEGTAVLQKDAEPPVPFVSGQSVGIPGMYTLTVTDESANETVVHFTIEAAPITVTGITYGGAYNHTVTPVFSGGDGQLSLDGGTPAPYASGTPLSAERTYVLTVANAYSGQAVSYPFTIDKTPPVVTGVTEGAVYQGSASALFTEGTAVLWKSIQQSYEQIDFVQQYDTVYYNEAADSGDLLETIELLETETVETYQMTGEEIVNPNYVSGTAIVEPGAYRLVVTDLATNSQEVGFSVEVIPSTEATATLTVPGTVERGQEFSAVIGVQHAVSMQAADITLSYDTSRFDYVADSQQTLAPAVQLHVAPGQGTIRLIVLVLGAEQAITGTSDLLSVKLRAKSSQPAGAGEVAIAHAIHADSLSVETEMERTVRLVAISQADASALQDAIQTAQTKLNTAQAGTLTGQFVPAALNDVLRPALQAALQAAQAVAGNANADVGEISAAVTQLHAAIAAFESHRITDATGNLNSQPGITIGDLALLASWYGVTSADTVRWPVAQSGDFNLNGVIDLGDMVFVAMRVLNQ